MITKAIPLTSVRRVLQKTGFIETKVDSGAHLVFHNKKSKALVTLPNSVVLRPAYVNAVIKTLVDNGLSTEYQVKLALKSGSRRHLTPISPRRVYRRADQPSIHVRETQ